MRVLLACLAGICGALTFALTSGADLTFADTRCLMILLAFMASTQLAVGLLQQPPTLPRLMAAMLAGVASGGLYGMSIRLIEAALASLHATQPMPMDALYFTGFALIFLVWIVSIFNLQTRLQSLSAWKRLYMIALNASQPHPQTVTTTRTNYQS